MSFAVCFAFRHHHSIDRCHVSGARLDRLSIALVDYDITVPDSKQRPYTSTSIVTRLYHTVRGPPQSGACCARVVCVVLWFAFHPTVTERTRRFEVSDNEHHVRSCRKHSRGGRCVLPRSVPSLPSRSPLAAWYLTDSPLTS